MGKTFFVNMVYGQTAFNKR